MLFNLQRDFKNMQNQFQHWIIKDWISFRVGIKSGEDWPGIVETSMDGLDEIMISTNDAEAWHGIDTVKLDGEFGQHNKWSQCRPQKGPMVKKRYYCPTD